MTVEIRIAVPNDARGLLDIYAPYCSSSTVSFEIAPPTEAEMRERIAQIGVRYPWLVAEIDGVLVGYVYANQHRERAAYRWAVDVAIYIAEFQRRRNIGRGLYTTLFTILGEQGFAQAYAGITLPNKGSVGLHEAVGFEPVAVFRNVGFKMGKWLDVGWWRLQLQPPSGTPSEPTSFDAIRENPVVNAAIASGVRLIRARTGK